MFIIIVINVLGRMFVIYSRVHPITDRSAPSGCLCGTARWRCGEAARWRCGEADLCRLTTSRSHGANKTRIKPVSSRLLLLSAARSPPLLVRFRGNTSLPQGLRPDGARYDGSGVCLDCGQTESYLKDTDMMGLASVWAMARRRPKEYRNKVDAATRCSGLCPHT